MRLLAAAMLFGAALLAPGGATGGGPLSVPLRIDAPAGAPADVRLPVGGGIPFPEGVLADAAQVCLTGPDGPLPCQAERTAVWPDGSVKWLRVDAVLPPSAKGLSLLYGPGTTPAAVVGPLEVRRGKGPAEVSGPGLSATVGNGLDRLRLGDRDATARPVFRSVRVSGPEAFAWASRHSADRSAKIADGAPVVTQVEVEAGGPVRARVCLRGHFRVPGWGTGLPERVLALEPAERVPFTLRFTFWRGVPAVQVDHQIVYTGEPDRDFILRWGLDLPALGADEERLVTEPGLTVDRRTAGAAVVPGLPGRLARARVAGGTAVVRDGYFERPVKVGGVGGPDAAIDFWPEEAGPFDLRRYAREWAVGETGDLENPADMERYARYAARGMAKTQTAILWLADGEPDDLARAFAGPALLVAPPSWYAASGALGDIAPEVREGPLARFESAVRRYLDWYRVCQDLYRWHGKTAYGLLQTRSGEIHRHDRFESDYGRWGWSLNDGAGRVGHASLLQYLRTLHRPYFEQGAAFCRATYDLAMVHTETHLENARDSWWRIRGCSHRHNVQPFGCPYIGVRGSSPGGHRIVWHLTGDGPLRDGLALVTQASLDYATGRPGAFGGSGSGPDGQGAGAEALLFGYETTGERRYLAACRTILDRSGLFPPRDAESLAGAGDFGLFLAAIEYARLSGDAEFRGRLRATAEAALGAKPHAGLLSLLAHGAGETGEERYRDRILSCLETVDVTNSLAELPPARWPGHGGPRLPPSRANWGRDLAFVAAAFPAADGAGGWPPATEDPVSLPGQVPDDWWRPGGAPAPRDRPPDAAALLERKPGRRGAAIEGLPDPADPFAEVSGNGSPAVRVLASPVEVEGRPGTRIAAAVDVPRSAGGLQSFGVRIRLPLSGDATRTFVSTAGEFRVERWRVDQGGEVVPQWLLSDRRSRWPLWRGGGIALLPAGGYRIWKQNRADTSPLYVDQGFGAPGWLDVTDRGAAPAFGVTARVLRSPDAPPGSECPAVSFDWERREMVVEFHSSSQAALPGPGAFAGAVDVLVHDGWRPPLSPPDLTREQYLKFLADLDYGGNLGLAALRFLLSETHQIPSAGIAERLADLGVEPREILVSMEWRDGLAAHCRRLGVRYDPERPDEAVRKVIERYRR